MESLFLLSLSARLSNLFSLGKRYIVEQTLGSGTFGTVVKAKLMRNAQFYAIKVMNSSDLQSFDEEVSVLTQVNKISLNLKNSKHS